MPSDTRPDWDEVLSSAARYQKLLPDADHLPIDLRAWFDEVHAMLESVAGWKSAHLQPSVQILGSLDGIDTGVRQLIRGEPLETTQVEIHGQKITVPTQAEILRIKGVLILKRNAMRDYLDFVALADSLGEAVVAEAMRPFDRLYPQPNGESAQQQLQIQLANPMPFDLDAEALPEHKHLDPRWRDWQAVKDACTWCAMTIFDGLDSGQAPGKRIRPDGCSM